MKAHIAIFADGDRAIGYGHLTRMRTLLGHLKLNAILVTRTPEEAKRIFSDTSLTILTASSETELLHAILENTREKGVVVLDPPYAAHIAETRSGPAWQKIVDEVRKSGRRIARFTDEETPSAHDCDVLVNDHPDSSAFARDYRRMGFRGTLLTGTQYFLIDPSHSAAPGTAGIIVSFGGGDQTNLVARFANVIVDLGHEMPVELILGPGHDGTFAEGRGVRVHRGLLPGKFASLLAGARMAVTASGNTLFERVYHQIPGISLAQSPHQDTLGRSFERLGVTRHLGMGAILAPHDLVEAARSLWHDQDRRNAQRYAARRIDIRSGCAEIVNTVMGLTLESLAQ